MGRPKKTLRPIPLNVSLDEDIAIKMKLELFSDLEGKIPHGAQSKLINQLLRKHFKSLAARRVEMARREAAGLAITELQAQAAQEALDGLEPETVIPQ